MLFGAMMLHSVAFWLVVFAPENDRAWRRRNFRLALGALFGALALNLLTTEHLVDGREMVNAAVRVVVEGVSE